MHASGSQLAANVKSPKRLLGDEKGATSLEWALLLGAIALPAYVIVITALKTLLAYYQMMTTLNALPFP